MKSDSKAIDAVPRGKMTAPEFSKLGMECIPTPAEVAHYQLATVFYDFKVHPEAARQITDIVNRLDNDLVKEGNKNG